MDDVTRSSGDYAADRIAAPLRTAERLSGAFESRLLTRVRDERAAEVQRQTKHPRSWWTTPRPVARTPLASMVLAAVFAVIVAMATLLFARADAGISLAPADSALTKRP